MILGISYGFHDAGVTLIDNNKILFAAHAERYSKVKHDSELNADILHEALSYGVPGQIAYYENPWNKKLRQAFAGQWSDALSLPKIKRTIVNATGLDKPITYVDHHKSHAAAGFATSPFDSAAVIVVDAIGEWDTMSIWHAKTLDNGVVEYNKLWANSYPHSIGLMYSAFTQRVGLRPLDEEYILMGMAGYGKPNVYKDMEADLISDLGELKFAKNMHLGVEKDYLKDSKDVDIAASVQELTEKLLNQVFSTARQKCGTQEQNVVFMGGVALNCVANRHLGEVFENIWIMPNPGDCGSSLGAAAAIYGKKLNWQHPYLGTNISGDYPVKGLIKHLKKHKIAGVASGRAEFGPRALGNRSLIADPRGATIKDEVNKIKRRQLFRPFAPAILTEHVHDYFDLPINWDKSDYMQVVATCKKPEEFPAIVHVDGTSRVQTVGKDSHTGFRKLLEAWYAETGCPMLLNTSLNIRGEPMVNVRSDADRFEQKYGVKVFS
jgi:carbamoyltransferase